VVERRATDWLGQGSKPGERGQYFSIPSRPALPFLRIISLFTTNLSDSLPVSRLWVVFNI
jgi:hypothetical protein